LRSGRLPILGAVAFCLKFKKSVIIALMLIDVGTYLQDTPDELVHRAILKRAAEFKIGKFFCIGVSPEDWGLVHSTARQDEQIVPFFGIHPWYADRVSPRWDKELLHIVSMNMGAGIGTIGLDRSANGGNYEKQKEVFLRQVQLAEQLSRPIAIHCSQAWDDLLNFLRDNKAPSVRFMVHAYQGDPETLEKLLTLGAYISFSWKNLFKTDPATLALVQQVPRDRLLLETGFPYMGSSKVDKGVSFEKYFKYLHETYVLAAQATGTDPGDLAEIIWKNGLIYLLGQCLEKEMHTPDPFLFSKTNQGMNLSKGKILVVDDDPSIVEILTMRLNVAGFEVCPARNGEEAVAKASTEKPLVIVMDVMMPVMSGYEAMQRIRQNPETKAIPAIILSGKASMKDFFSDMSGVEFIQKPFDLKILMNGVEALAGGAQRRANQSKRVVLAGVEDLLVSKLRNLLKGLHFEVFTALNEENAVRLIESLHPAMILCQFWEDEKILDPRKLAQGLSSKPALAAIPFYVYCKEALSLEAMKHFKTDKIVTYKEASDLLLAVEVIAKK
jgi:TatD DNase family protein